MDGCPEVSSFAVFDGHNGSMAASTCSQYFNRRVAKRISAMKAVKHSFSRPDFSGQDEMDAIVTTSIVLTVQEINANILRSHHSGSTLSALFLVHDPESGDTRIYCANVGDSRCVAFLRNNDDVSVEDAILSTEHDSVKTSASVYNAVLAYQMSEDHKLSLARERKRIEQQLECRVPSLPSEVVKGYMLLSTRMTRGKDNESSDDTVLSLSTHSATHDDSNALARDPDRGSSFVELGAPPTAMEAAAREFIQLISVGLDIQPKPLTYGLSSNVIMVSALDQTSNGSYLNHVFD